MSVYEVHTSKYYLSCFGTVTTTSNQVLAKGQLLSSELLNEVPVPTSCNLFFNHHMLKFVIHSSGNERYNHLHRQVKQMLRLWPMAKNNQNC